MHDYSKLFKTEHVQVQSLCNYIILIPVNINRFQHVETFLLKNISSVSKNRAISGVGGGGVVLSSSTCRQNFVRTINSTCYIQTSYWRKFIMNEEPILDYIKVFNFKIDTEG